MSKNIRRRKLDRLRKSFNKWRSLQEGIHKLSPCDPRKLEYKKSAIEWNSIFSEDPELFDRMLEIEEFEDVFLSDAP